MMTMVMVVREEVSTSPLHACLTSSALAVPSQSISPSVPSHPLSSMGGRVGGGGVLAALLLASGTLSPSDIRPTESFSIFKTDLYTHLPRQANTRLPLVLLVCGLV